MKGGPEVRKIDRNMEIEDCWDCSHMSTTDGLSVEPMCSHGLGWGWGISGRVVSADELPFPEWCPLNKGDGAGCEKEILRECSGD